MSNLRAWVPGSCFQATHQVHYNSSLRGHSKMTSAEEGGREVNRISRNRWLLLFKIANSIVLTVTREGGRCENGRFCGDVIFEWLLMALFSNLHFHLFFSFLSHLFLYYHHLNPYLNLKTLKKTSNRVGNHIGFLKVRCQWDHYSAKPRFWLCNRRLMVMIR